MALYKPKNLTNKKDNNEIDIKAYFKGLSLKQEDINS